MKKILFLLLIPFMLFASKILSYNVYERSDKVDVMLTFDTPYDGVISQQTLDGKIIIKLEGASIESEKVKSLNSKFISELTISPITTYTQIVAVIPNDVQVQASRTVDSYGLRLRFDKQGAAATEPNATTAATTALPTGPDLQISTGYYVVMAILLTTLGFVFYLKKKMGAVISQTKPTTSSAKPLKKPWMFGAKTEVHEDLQVRFSKQLDQVNRIVMVDYGNLSYLILAGQSNILLDKFEDDKPLNKNEFEDILRDRNDELNAILNNRPQEKEPFQTYKEKAASIAYDAYDA
ncbi:MAG: hypothetical protein PHX13_00455 [Thiovulaceae bacterium]|nr:hypothetical protein [Sulfurimonadaceae bacterium]